MKTIWKYPLKAVDIQLLEMPEGAEILTVQFQAGNLCLWALVDSEKPKTMRYIRIYGTGIPLEQINLQYITTYQVADGRLIFHVFEEIL